LLNGSSIGLRSGEYCGRYCSVAPAAASGMRRSWSPNFRRRPRCADWPPRPSRRGWPPWLRRSFQSSGLDLTGSTGLISAPEERKILDSTGVSAPAIRAAKEQKVIQITDDAVPPRLSPHDEIPAWGDDRGKQGRPVSASRARVSEDCTDTPTRRPPG
jgi:hypothetical protein